MAIQRKLISAATLGVNGATAANGVPVTSNGIACGEFTEMLARVALTYVSATRLDVDVQYSFDDSTYTSFDTTSVAAGVTTHTSGDEHQMTTGAASCVMTIERPVNAEYIRLVIEGVGGTTDTVSAQILFTDM